MKTRVFFILFMIFVCGSCRKREKEGGAKQCSYALFALKPTSGGYYKIVTVDTATGKSVDNLPFTKVYGFQGYMDPRNKCYYTVEADSTGLMTLYKLDLLKNNTKVFHGRNWGSRSNFALTYSVSADRFYFIYQNNNLYTPFSDLYVLGVSNDSFTYEKVEFKPDHIEYIHTPVANEKTGAIYFVAPGKHAYVKMDPHTYEATAIGEDGVINPVFNTNDGQVYGIRTYSSGPGVFEFVKQNPETGTITTISSVPQFDVAYWSADIDECSNQFILHNVSTNNTTEVFWYDISTGAKMKHVVLGDAVRRLLSISID